MEPREVVVNDAQANSIGLKVAQNEGVRNRLDQLSWPDDARFSSFGIAHLPWYPQAENNSALSFNGFLLYWSKSQALPDWLIEVYYPPWNSKEDYLSTKHDVFQRKLSYFLQDNISAQTQYLIANLEARLPKMLQEVKNPFARMHVYENFYHVSMQQNGVYALLDYYVFKGEGISPEERYNNQGWGLLQVLENMQGSSDDLIDAFVSSADVILTRRIVNAPSNEKKQLVAWRKRVQTYGELSTRSD